MMILFFVIQWFDIYTADLFLAILFVKRERGSAIRDYPLSYILYFTRTMGLL